MKQAIVADNKLDQDPEPPTTFEEFMERWQERVRGIVYRSGFKGDLLEEVVQDVFVKLWEAKHVDRWWAEREQRAVDGKGAPFGKWTSMNVQWLVMNAKRSLVKQQRDEAVGIDYEDGNTIEIPDLDQAAAIGAATECAALQPALQEVYDALRQVPTTGMVPPAELFRQLVAQADADGKANYEEIAWENGCTRQAISLRVKTLRRLPAVAALRAELVAAGA